MGKLFGTDGVRGIANEELTPELAMKLGQAGAFVLTRETAHQPTLIVGCDTRISGRMLANALMAGICSVGANAVCVGVVPTPAVAYLTRYYHADAGVVISASHNPMEFNGIKFFNNFGYKLSDELEAEIEHIIAEDLKEVVRPVGSGVGCVKYNMDAKEDYIRYVKSMVPLELEGMKIVVDCAEGAAYCTAVQALEDMGAEIYPIHNHPDGTNINTQCGSTHMDDLIAAVIKQGADLGIAFDGDADRMLAVDEQGKLVCGDEILAICGTYMMQQGTLKNNKIIATVMSNLGLVLLCRDKNIQLEQTKVGDRYVMEQMLSQDAILGGENSGHIIFLDENTTGDGLLSALHILEVMVKTKKKLSELADVMKVLPQALVNAVVPNSKKDSYMDYPVIAEAIVKLEQEFCGEGRVLIRSSGTEPLVRVMIEGKEQKLIQKRAEELAELIKNTLR